MDLGYDYKQEGCNSMKSELRLGSPHVAEIIGLCNLKKVVGAPPGHRLSQPKWCQQVLLRRSLPHAPGVGVTGVLQTRPNKLS